MFLMREKFYVSGRETYVSGAKTHVLRRETYVSALAIKKIVSSKKEMRYEWF